MTGERWRLVTTQDGDGYVSSIVVSRDEAVEQLRTEALLHRAAGWEVEEFDFLLLARRGGTERIITARAFSPHDDAQSGTV